MPGYPTVLSFELPDEFVALEVHGNPTVTGSTAAADVAATSRAAAATGDQSSARTAVTSVTVDTDATTTTATTEGECS